MPDDGTTRNLDGGTGPPPTVRQTTRGAVLVAALLAFGVTSACSSSGKRETGAVVGVEVAIDASEAARASR